MTTSNIVLISVFGVVVTGGIIATVIIFKKKPATTSAPISTTTTTSDTTQHGGIISALKGIGEGLTIGKIGVTGESNFLGYNIQTS